MSRFPQELLWYANRAPVAPPSTTPVATREHRTCGDCCSFALATENGRVTAVYGSRTGCALMRAVAGWIEEWTVGKTAEEILALPEDFAVRSWGFTVGPLRARCALLPIATLHDAASLAFHAQTGTARD